MANKKKKETAGNMPMSAVDSTGQSSSITYANDVVAIIAGLAASEVEGIAGMVNVNNSLLGKNRNITRGVKVEVGTEEVGVDLYINVEYGTPIQRAAHDAQENVKKALESMTGLHVVRVDVHVMGVSFEKEMNALQAGAGKAVLESGNAEEKKAALTGKASPGAGINENTSVESPRKTEVNKADADMAEKDEQATRYASEEDLQDAIEAAEEAESILEMARMDGTDKDPDVEISFIEDEEETGRAVDLDAVKPDENESKPDGKTEQ